MSVEELSLLIQWVYCILNIETTCLHRSETATR